jgi:hypothetical protein
MGTVQEQVDKWLHELPRQLGAELIDKKLRAQKIVLSEKRLNELVDRILAGEDGIQIEVGKRKKDFCLEFTDADSAALQKRADEVIEKLPAIIDSASEGFSDTIFAASRRIGAVNDACSDATWTASASASMSVGVKGLKACECSPRSPASLAMGLTRMAALPTAVPTR